MHDEVFHKIFIQTLRDYASELNLVDGLWSDIVNRYTTPSRHYHTLIHLDHMMTELLEVKNKIFDWNLVVFAVAYHDIIYDVLKNDNEAESAAYAARALSNILENSQIEKCRQLIIATKLHDLSPEPDVNYFTDADLAILGSDTKNYFIYSSQIRKEYAIFPDIIYSQGRKKVLKHFLQMDRIYKTDYFFNRYERKARINMELEMERIW